MSINNRIGRRKFLRNAALASSILIVPRHVLGGRGYVPPSDKIAMGIIGCGRQSSGLRRRFSAIADVQIIAAADPYALKLERLAQLNNEVYASLSGQERYAATATFADYRELLALKDVDAVIIASPDHWHASMAVHAAEAGKDIYCEKPLSLTVKEGRAMVKATRKHNRVFQTGNMQRSFPEFTQAVQLVRSGAIGEIHKIIVSVGGPPKDWDLQPEPLPQGLNWELWMGPNFIDRPYNNVLAPDIDATFWPKWRDYKEFGGGGMTDWGAHMFDIGQWGLDMDHSGPVKVIVPGPGNSSGLVFEYVNGVQMIHQTNKGNYCHFLGSEGEVFVQRGTLRTTPETLKEKVFDRSAYKIYVSDNHFEDFVQAIRTRKKPICDVEVGHRTATVCNIGNIAYQLGRTLEWDPEKEKFRKDREANKLLGRKMKREWRV